jgi:hypothetical protein
MEMLLFNCGTKQYKEQSIAVARRNPLPPFLVEMDRFLRAELTPGS